MNEVLEQMQANVTNGEEYFCDISEKKLEIMKVLARREKEELEQLQQENKELKEEIEEYKRIEMKDLEEIQRLEEQLEGDK